MAKTKVASIKSLNIPRLELCGVVIVAKILSHVVKTLDISTKQVHISLDRVIVLSWLDGNPQHFKTFVGNRVSEIPDLTLPTCWHHISSEDNTADCALRGLFPSELTQHAS